MGKIKSISISEIGNYTYCENYGKSEGENFVKINKLISDCINSLEGSILNRDLIISLPKLEQFSWNENTIDADLIKIQEEEGINFSDLLGLINRLNNYVGQGIEEHLGESLNRTLVLSNIENLEFYRNSSQFPDLFLIDNSTKEILLSIELKSWFVFSGDEITARFHTSPDAIPEGSLLIIYPWTLNKIISGSPLLLMPHVTDAKELARKRDTTWTKEGRRKIETIGEMGIKSPINKIRNKSIGVQWNEKTSSWETESDNFGKIWRIYDESINIDFYSLAMRHLLDNRSIADWRNIFGLSVKTSNMKKSAIKKERLL